MSKTPYDSRTPDFEAVRRIFLDWLRVNGNVSQLDLSGQAYEGQVEWIGPRQPNILAFHIHDIFWQLLIEGIVAPGMNPANPNLPYFHVTQYGRKVLASDAGHPYDPTGYIARLQDRVPNIDATVIAYLRESLDAFRRGSPVASTVMLGIAAERVFLLLCDSMLAALADSKDRLTFQKLLDRFPMKPKLDWIHSKIQEIEAKRLAGFPDNASLMVTAIYDILRSQRNDLGHPRANPPQVTREDAFVNLQVFQRYYETAEEVRRYFATNSA